MKTYRVTVTRTSIDECTVEVSATDGDSACERALELVDTNPDAHTWSEDDSPEYDVDDVIVAGDKNEENDE